MAGGRNSSSAVRRWWKPSPWRAPFRTTIPRRVPDTPGSNPATRAASRAGSHTAGRRDRWPTIQARRAESGRPTSPTNSVSPVSTACGTRIAHGAVVYENRDRFRRVPGCFEGFQPHSLRARCVSPSPNGVNAYSACAERPEVNRRAGLLLQLEMAGDEVGVEVSEDDVPYRQAVLAANATY